MKYIVYYTETGQEVSRHNTEAEAREAIEKYNAFSSTYGFLDYDYKAVKQ